LTQADTGSNVDIIMVGGDALSSTPWRICLATPVIAAIGLLGIVPRGASAARVTTLANVTFIDRGLGVQPPRRPVHSGKVKMPLFTEYGLRTAVKERAAIGFRDGTTMHMNAVTDAVLTDPHVIHVKNGEIALYLKPGSNHTVQTQAAVATAIGTVYDLVIHKDDSTYIVVHGALQVTNKFGTVVAKTNQQTTAGPDHAPTTPKHVNGAAAIGWTAGMPRKDLGENMALDADGGQIAGFSSQDVGVGHRWDVHFINDGLVQKGWRSAPGKTKNQWVKFAFSGGRTYRVTDVIIDPAATGGNPPASDVRQFELRLSITGTRDADFHTVATGTCLRQASLQDFHFNDARPARYAEIVFKNNYGGTRYVEVAEVEVVAAPM
jgi:hypothetical protein